MGGSLIQLYRMKEEEPLACKLLLTKVEIDHFWKKSPGKIPSRGETEGASAIQNDWA